MNKTLLFLDLDDTLFQTLRKKPTGSVPATQNVSTLSYMTPAQHRFWQLFAHQADVSIIPVTARNQRQYQNTFLFQEQRIETAVLYFSGLILRQGNVDETWQQHIQTAYKHLSFSIAELYANLQHELKENLSEQMSLYNVDDYYVTLKVTPEYSLEQRQQLFKHLRNFLPPGYFVHENGRALSWLPEFLDKRHAVQYLIECYQPELTLGAGDSLSDWGFMQLCDYRLIPSETQLDSACTPA